MLLSYVDSRHEPNVAVAQLLDAMGVTPPVTVVIRRR